MSLRRSPRRTPALLAANRANAQKSTGPRTALGKQRSAANLLRTGPGLPAGFWERSLSHGLIDEYLARTGLRYAVLPDHTDQTLSDAVSDLVVAMRTRAMRAAAKGDPRRPRRKSRRGPEVSP